MGGTSIAPRTCRGRPNGQAVIPSPRWGAPPGGGSLTDGDPLPRYAFRHAGLRRAATGPRQGVLRLGEGRRVPRLRSVALELRRHRDALAGRRRGDRAGGLVHLQEPRGRGRATTASGQCSPPDHAPAALSRICPTPHTHRFNSRAACSMQGSHNPSTPPQAVRFC